MRVVRNLDGGMGVVAGWLDRVSEFVTLSHVRYEDSVGTSGTRLC